MPVNTETLTFLFTSVESSATGWERYPKQMRLALERFESLSTPIIQQGGGRTVRARGESDTLFAVFDRPANAVRAALRLQLAVSSEAWPDEIEIRLQQALHTGDAESRDGDYYGPPVNRCARMRSMAYGGQILVTMVTKHLAEQDLPQGVSFKDLGSHRLKDLADPEHVFQLVHPDLLFEFPPLRSLDALPNNLPVQLTSFVGREKEIAEAIELLEDARLLSLTGSGGCGKTRLGLQVAAEVMEKFKDGVWLIELATVGDPQLITSAIASALHLREEPGRDPGDTLIDYLKEKRVLLVLDNCEHLVEPVSHLVERILRACTRIQIIATSREALGVAGEISRRVPSLALPDPLSLPRVETLSRFESINLFIQRAQLANPSFQFTQENAPWVAQLCHRLDGIPLALELAAARVKVLSVEQIAERLDDRFKLLTGGSRTALPRQQTLRALVDWSYDLLTAKERSLWVSLSLFAGGFTLEAAEAVCSDESCRPDEILNLLSQLIDKSLVMVDTDRSEPRYRLLETIRQYGRDKLAGSEFEEPLAERFCDWFLDLAEEAEEGLGGPDLKDWLRRLEDEYDNIRVAVEWRRDRDGAERALRLSSALWEYAEIRGLAGEQRRWIEDALTLYGTSGDNVRAKALKAAGNLAETQGDYPAARRYYEEYLEIEREAGDRHGIARALNNLGVVSQHQKDLPAARDFYEEALQIMREIDDERGVGILLNNLGSVAENLKESDLAVSLYEESLVLRRRRGDKRMVAQTLMNLGNVAKTKGDHVRAKGLYEESLEIRTDLDDRAGIALVLQNLAGTTDELGDRPTAKSYYEQSLRLKREVGLRKGAAECCEELASIYALAGDSLLAARLLGGAAALRKSMGIPESGFPTSAETRDGIIDSVGVEPFEISYKEGLEMTPEQVFTTALGD